MFKSDGSTRTGLVSVFALMLMLFAGLAVMMPAGAENSPPDIMSNPETVAWVGHVYNYQVLAIDYDNDMLNYTLFFSPAGMKINRTTGVIKWTPTKDQSGKTQIVGIAVIDPSGAKDMQNYTIDVYEPPPPWVMLNTPYYGQEVSGILIIEGYAFQGYYGYNSSGGGEVSNLNLTLDIYNLDKVVVWTFKMVVKAGGKEPNREPSFKVEWDSAKVKDDKYFIIATVTDADGLTGNAQVDFSVHNTHSGEVVWFNGPQDGAMVDGYVRFKGGASKDYDVVKVQMRIDTNDMNGQTKMVLDWTTAYGTYEWNYGFNFTQLQTQNPGACYIVAARAMNNDKDLGHAKIGVCTQGGIPPPPPPANVKAWFKMPQNGETVKGSVNVVLAGVCTVEAMLRADLQIADHTGKTNTLNFEGKNNGKDATMWNFTWDSTQVADGTVYFGLTVTADNGASAFASMSVIVNNTATPPPPQGDFKAWFDYPTDGQSVANTVNVVYGAAPNWDGTISGALDIWDSNNKTVRFPVSGSVGINQKIVWTASWDTRQMANGFAQLALKVEDAQGGNKVAYARVNVWIDNSITNPPPPVDNVSISFTSPKDGSTVSGKVTVTGRTYTLAKIKTLQVDISLDGKPYTTTFTTGGGWSDFTFEIDTSKLMDGTHKLKATVSLGGQYYTAGLSLIVKHGGVPPPPIPPPVVPDGKKNSDGSVSVDDTNVSFEAPTYSGMNGNTTTYTWNFGDGTTSNEKNPTHKYGKSGTYNVSLTASDGTTQKESAVNLKVGPTYKTHVPGFGASALVLALVIGCVAAFFRRRK